MNSKERVRNAVMYRKPDRIPVGFEAVPSVVEKIMKAHNLRSFKELIDFYQVDICDCNPNYIGKRTATRTEGDKTIAESIYGGEVWLKNNKGEIHAVMHKYPFDENTTVQDILSHDWITPDDFDYESVKRKCDLYKDKALIVGHEGPFQISTFMMDMAILFEKMVLEEDVAHALFDRFVQFELEYYERILMAADGQIDILRPHDDYGTQQNLLFSVQMFDVYFAENTKKLVNLAHKYNCFYQQHSCGAVHDLIPSLIGCGVDILEPLQKVQGMEAERLQKDFGGKIAFHGGIDTQSLLPFGTPEEVRTECRHFAEVLGKNGGYILMASQAFESDVPVENIDALYEEKNRSMIF